MAAGSFANGLGVPALSVGPDTRSTRESVRKSPPINTSCRPSRVHHARTAPPADTCTFRPGSGNDWTYTSNRPLSSDVYAIQRPSGDTGPPLSRTGPRAMIVGGIVPDALSNHTFCDVS